jgi:dsRNA-specific ribonuclease
MISKFNISNKINDDTDSSSDNELYNNIIYNSVNKHLNNSNSCNDDNSIKMYHIHNSKNKWITEDFINNILEKYGVHKKVNNIKIWKEATIHKSYCSNRKRFFCNEIIDKPDDGIDYIDIQDKSGEVYEWIGDGIIQSIMVQYLTSRYSNKDEGFLSKTRAKIVKTETLSKLAKIIGLQNYVIISKYCEDELNAREIPNVLEDAFEAFIGAMSKDLGNGNDIEGYSHCHTFFIKLIERKIDMAALIAKNDNYKDILMRYFHKTFDGHNPSYQNIKTTINGRNKSFVEAVIDSNGKIICTGEGKNKKEAQQIAAKNALIIYGVNE